MDSRQLKFLEAVLGAEGAKALMSAGNRAPGIASAMLPRTIVAWLGVAGRSDYEGPVPGDENSYLSFTKSEEGSYSGVISLAEGNYSFSQANLIHLGAVIAVSLGSSPEGISSNSLKDLDLQKLGKNIDTLAKARVAIHELKKRVLDPSLGYRFSHEHHDLGNGQMVTKVNAHTPTGEHVGAATFTHQGPHIVPGTVAVDDDHQRRGLASAMYAHAQKQTGKIIKPSANQTTEGAALWAGNAKHPQFGKGEKRPTGGVETPGPAHAPTPPLGPIGPVTPQATQPSKGPTVGLRPTPPKLPTPKASTDVVQTGHANKQPKSKSPVLKVSKSQADTSCQVCGFKQFENDSFVGCVCLADLSKSITTTKTTAGYSLDFGKDLGQDEILTIIDALGDK